MTGLTPFRDLPIQRKLVVVAWSVSLSALLLSTVISVVAGYFIGRSNAVLGSGILASIVADNLTAAAAFEDSTSASETIRALRSTPTVDGACAYGPNRALLAEVTQKTSFRCPAAPPPDQQGVDGATITVVRPIVLDNRRVGTVYVQSNVTRLVEQFRLQGLVAVASAAAGLVLAWGIAVRLNRQIAGPILSLSATSAAISREGNYAGRARKTSNDEIGQFVDVFNRMLDDIQRREEELRASNRSKDEFLAALSHELRTPMHALVGWLQILRSHPDDRKLVDDALERMDRNARTQMRLVEDLLDISRIVSGKMELRRTGVDLAAVAQSALGVIAPSLAAKQLELDTTLPHFPCLVFADADRLQQVLANLLSNAIKFTPRGGRVALRIRREGDQWILTVQDTGIGIEPEFLPHVFDRFRQADGSITRQHGGLGLGLAIAHDLVELHGGRLTAESEGRHTGATFTLALPRFERADAGAAPADAGAAISLKGFVVLVVDDDQDARLVADQALSNAGARVVQAADAGEALAAVGRQEFDALVCDLQMPHVDGFELLKQIRDREWAGGRFTPAVAVTAHAYSAQQREALRTGYEEFVIKPFDFATLTAAVAKVVHAQAVRS